MKEQVNELWKNYLASKSKEDEKKLVEYYYKTIVTSISKNLAKKIKYKLSSEELASYGVIGLYSAINAFDHEKGVKFETYAFSRIWGSMIDKIRQDDWVPRSARARYNMFEKTREKLEAKYGCKISEDKIIEESGIDEKYRNKYNPIFCFSIESPNDESDNIEEKDIYKYLEDTKSVSPDNNLLKKEFIRKICENGLSDIERKTLYYHYYEGLAFRHIASKLNISESRVGQIHKKMINKLRKKIKSNKEYFDNKLVEIFGK